MPLLPCQERLLRSQDFLRCLFGGWGSGKTRGGAFGILDLAARNPWTPEYGRDAPFSLVIGWTHKVLRDSAHRELVAVMPREIVLRERNGADWEIQLVNGHALRFRTAKGSIEGSSACGVWLDEAHLIRDKRVFLNYQARARDPRARAHGVIVTGLPLAGWLQDTFGHPEAGRTVIHARTSDNVYLPAHVVAEFRRSASANEARTLLDGEWMPPEGLIYHQFGADNLIAYAGDRNRPVHVSFDVGDLGSILWVQERKVRTADGSEVLGLHVVDEARTTNQSVLQQMRLAAGRGWQIVPGPSRIYADPTIRRDEIAAIREVFGDQISIVRAQRGTVTENVEFGIASVNAALRAADGTVRLTFWSGLDQRDERSLLTAIRRYHRRTTSLRPERDNVVDHVMDTLRYPVAHMLPTRETFSSRAGLESRAA